MKKMVCLLALSLLFVAACETTGGVAKTDAGKADGGKTEGGGGAAMADPDVKDEDGYFALLEDYKSGKRQADCYIPIHDVVAAWQYCEFTRTEGGKKTVEKWCVGRVVTSEMTAMIERDMGFYLLGYEVDLKVPRADAATKGNVKRAFIGRKGWEPRAIQVAKPPSANPPRDYAGAKAEAFDGMTLFGKEFYGQCYTWIESGVEIKEWVAGNGWFNRILKRTEGGQTTFELTKRSSETRPALDWKW